MTDNRKSEGLSACLLYTSDAADERVPVVMGGGGGGG